MAEFGAEHNGDDRVSEEVTPAPPPKGIDEVLYSDVSRHQIKESVPRNRDQADFDIYRLASPPSSIA